VHQLCVAVRVVEWLGHDVFVFWVVAKKRLERLEGLGTAVLVGVGGSQVQPSLHVGRVQVERLLQGGDRQHVLKVVFNEWVVGKKVIMNLLVHRLSLSEQEPGLGVFRVPLDLRLQSQDGLNNAMLLEKVLGVRLRVGCVQKRVGGRKYVRGVHLLVVPARRTH